MDIYCRDTEEKKQNPFWALRIQFQERHKTFVFFYPPPPPPHTHTYKSKKTTFTDKLFCKFTDHRVFYLAITDHRHYLCHKSQTYFQPFHKSQTFKKGQSKVTEKPLHTPTPTPTSHPKKNKKITEKQARYFQISLVLLWGWPWGVYRLSCDPGWDLGPSFWSGI